MKKEKKKTKSIPQKKQDSKSNIPKTIKKGKPKSNKEEDSDLDEMDSFSDIYDSDEEILTQDMEEGSLSQFSEDDVNSQDELEKELQEEFQKSKKSQSLVDFETSKSELENIINSRKDQNNGDKMNLENKKKLEELQRIRLEKYLKKPTIDAVSLKTEDQAGPKIKLQNHENSSVIPEPSEISYQQQSSQVGTQRIKVDNSNSISFKGVSESQNPQFLSYLVNIMNGTVTPEDLEFRKKQEEKRQKLQDKIKQLQKRKIEQKLKKEFDERTQSQMKVLSTNMDSIYDKNENSSFRMPLKSQEGTKFTGKEQEFHMTGRKKRTRVTTEMLKLILKDFQYMAKQQNGLVPDNLKVTFKDIGKKYKLGRSSVMKMYSDYCKDPTMKRRFESKQPMAHNRSMMELTKRRITFIEKLIRKDCTLSQREIAAEMNDHDDLKCKRKKRPDQTAEEYMKNPYHSVAYKAVSRLMKIGNFTRKKVTLIPKNRNSQRTVEERYNFCKILNELIQDDKNKLYFLDECRFNLFTSRDWGWAPKGELATKVRHNSKGKDVMLLAIIGKEGLVGHEISDSYIRGSFTIAVNKLINSIIPEVVPQGQRIYLILDNCPIHNKDNLKEMESKKPLTILYLPPYSPMLNPIESWFGELKRIIKSKIYKTRQAMRAELATVLETYKNKSLQNYYKGIKKYIALGLKKQLYRGNNKF